MNTKRSNALELFGDSSTSDDSQDDKYSEKTSSTIVDDRTDMLIQRRQKHVSHSVPQTHRFDDIDASTRHTNTYKKNRKYPRMSPCCPPWIWLPVMIGIIALVSIFALIISCHTYMIVRSHLYVFEQHIGVNQTYGTYPEQSESLSFI